MNEAYENPAPGGTHAGITMDLLVFDIGGILLFNSDRVSRFFAQNLGASIWPTQASLLIPEGALWNNSHHLVLKVPMGFTDRASLFLKSGIGLQAGLTLHRANDLDVSFGFGKESTERVIDPVTRLETAQFAWAGGVWVDRGGSLLVSLLIDTNTDRVAAVNVYPGVIPGLGDFGLWAAVDNKGRPSIGITTARTLGLGLGVRF
jgi:hypothetical protein